MTTQEKVTLFLNDPTKENFKKIEDYFFVWRLIYRKDKSILLSHISDYLDKKSFFELLTICERLDRSFHPLIGEKIRKFEQANDLEQLAFSYQYASPQVQELLLFLMGIIKGDFEQWERIYSYTNEELKDLAIRKINELM